MKAITKEIVTYKLYNDTIVVESNSISDYNSPNFTQQWSTRQKTTESI